MTIQLPPDLERSLQDEARKRGTTLEECAVELLRNGLPKRPAVQEGEGETLYDFLAPFIGTWDGPAEPLSEDTGRKFGEIVEALRAVDRAR